MFGRCSESKSVQGTTRAESDFSTIRKDDVTIENMEQNKIDELVAKYNEGLTDPSEVQQLEQLIEEGKVELTQLRSLDLLEDRLIAIESPSPSLALDDKFYAMLSKEKKKVESSSASFSMPS